MGIFSAAEQEVGKVLAVRTRAMMKSRHHSLYINTPIRVLQTTYHSAAKVHYSLPLHPTL